MQSATKRYINIRKIEEQFEVSYFMARRSKLLVAQNGILTTPARKFGSRTLSPGLVAQIQNFFVMMITVVHATESETT